MSLKTLRLASSIAKEISTILMLEVDDKNVKFVSVNHVDLSSDMSYAKVYFTTFNKEYKDITKKALNSSSGFIRGKLAKKVDMRHIPKLEFIYDDSIEYGNKIENKIKEIKDGK